MEGVSRALDDGRMATAQSHFTGKNYVSGIRIFGRVFGYYWAAFHLIYSQGVLGVW